MNLIWKWFLGPSLTQLLSCQVSLFSVLSNLFQGFRHWSIPPLWWVLGDFRSNTGQLHLLPPYLPVVQSDPELDWAGGLWGQGLAITIWQVFGKLPFLGGNSYPWPMRTILPGTHARFRQPVGNRWIKVFSVLRSYILLIRLPTLPLKSWT